jgi:hypothetical protein
MGVGNLGERLAISAIDVGLLEDGEDVIRPFGRLACLSKLRWTEIKYSHLRPEVVTVLLNEGRSRCQLSSCLIPES